MEADSGAVYQKFRRRRCQMDELLSRWSAYFDMTETQFVWAVVVITVLIALLVRFFRSLVDEGTSSKQHAKAQGRPKLPGGGPSVAGGSID